MILGDNHLDAAETADFVEHAGVNGPLAERGIDAIEYCHEFFAVLNRHVHDHVDGCFGVCLYVAYKAYNQRLENDESALTLIFLPFGVDDARNRFHFPIRKPPLVLFRIHMTVIVCRSKNA